MATPYKVGEMLFLVLANDMKEEEEIFKARIADITADHIAIELPLSQKTGKMAFFSTGEVLEASFISDSGTKFSFETALIGRQYDNIHLHLIQHPDPDKITKTQRRQFLRVPTSNELAIHPLQDGEFEPLNVQTADLSGGGLSFINFNGQQLEEGTAVSWWLTLPMKDGEISHPHGQGEIVRVIPGQEAGLPTTYSLKFTEIKEHDVQQIMRYCFHKQLELKNKGLE